MGRQFALSIGIGSADMFRPLPGAIAGAEAFERWAKSQDFQTLPIYDTAGPVTADRLKDAVADAVRAHVERLFIFLPAMASARGKGRTAGCSATPCRTPTPRST
jgi:hypothetical protein